MFIKCGFVQVVGAKTKAGWVRGVTKKKCSEKSCSLREGWEGPQQPQQQEEDDDSAAREDHWHVTLLDHGSQVCCPYSDMILVTRDLAGIEAKATQFTLTKVYQSDKNRDEVRGNFFFTSVRFLSFSV